MLLTSFIDYGPGIQPGQPPVFGNTPRHDAV